MAIAQHRRTFCQKTGVWVAIAQKTTLRNVPIKPFKWGRKLKNKGNAIITV